MAENPDLDPLVGENGGERGRRIAQYWFDQLDAVSGNAEFKRWEKRGRDIEKRYRDERVRSDTGDDSQRHYNALWANVQILQPAIYGKAPVPIAERRFRDKDPVGRGAAQILERGLRNEVEICGFDEAMQQAVADYLLPGRGTLWVRYEPVIAQSASLAPQTQTDIKDHEGATTSEEGTVAPEGNIDDPLGQAALDGGNQPGPEAGGEPERADEDAEEEKLQSTNDQVLRESTPVDYVPWPDFRTLPIRARVWGEATAVAKRVYMSRGQMKRRFGDKIGSAIPLKRDDRGEKHTASNESPSDQDKGQVWEIWSKSDKTVYWVAFGYAYLCDRRDDPLNLENFFPCPKPLFANATNTTLIPVPDYIEYQDQAIQIDELTHRIAMLAKACKVAGVYNAAATEIKRLLQESVENELIPVDDWAAFGNEGGGVAGNISLLPLKEIMGVINELMMVRDKAILDMDRLTGITDIMRGTTDARETLGGQRLKTNSAGTRLQRRQNEVARFARDTIRIMADIMSQHFSPISLVEVSGALYEEGLGTVDMPSLTDLQPPSPQVPPPVGMPPGGLPSPNQPPGGQIPPMGQPPTGQNVVPFRPPMPPAPFGMPPGGPAGLMGEVLRPDPAEQARMAGIQRIAASIKLLRDEQLRGFRVDIEVDSTIYGDLAQDKSDRIEFISSTTKFLEQAMMMGAQMPEILPLMGKMLQFGVRGFRVGRDLEAAIEEFCDTAPAMVQKKQQQAAQNPTPQMLTAQAAMLKAKSSIGAEQQAAMTAKAKAAADIRGQELKNQADQQQSGAEVARQHLENMGEQANMAGNLEIKRLELKMKQMELDMQAAQGERDRMQAEMEAPPPAPEPEAPKEPAGPSNNEVMAALAKAIEGMTSSMNAPVELVRDPQTGKAMGSRKRMF